MNWLIFLFIRCASNTTLAVCPYDSNMRHPHRNMSNKDKTWDSYRPIVFSVTQEVIRLFPVPVLRMNSVALFENLFHSLEIDKCIGTIQWNLKYTEAPLCPKAWELSPAQNKERFWSFQGVDVLKWAATRINVYSHHVLRYGKRCVMVSCNARNEQGETGFLCLKFAKKLKEQSVCHLLAPIGTARWVCAYRDRVFLFTFFLLPTVYSCVGSVLSLRGNECSLCQRFCFFLLSLL